MLRMIYWKRKTSDNVVVSNGEVLIVGFGFVQPLEFLMTWLLSWFEMEAIHKH